jgi:hypothetical protein
MRKANRHKPPPLAASDPLLIITAASYCPSEGIPIARNDIEEKDAACSEHQKPNRYSLTQDGGAASELIHDAVSLRYYRSLFRLLLSIAVAFDCCCFRSLLSITAYRSQLSIAAYRSQLSIAAFDRSLSIAAFDRCFRLLLIDCSFRLPFTVTSS